MGLGFHLIVTPTVIFFCYVPNLCRHRPEALSIKWSEKT